MVQVSMANSKLNGNGRLNSNSPTCASRKLESIDYIYILPTCLNRYFPFDSLNRPILVQNEHFNRHFPYGSLSGEIQGSNGISPQGFLSGDRFWTRPTPPVQGDNPISMHLAAFGHTSPADSTSPPCLCTPVSLWSCGMRQWPETRDQGEDLLEQGPWHGHLGQLECEVAPVPNNLGSDLDELLPNRC